MSEVELQPLNLISPNDQILHTKMEAFDFKNPPMDPVLLANQLITTMNHHNGLGLSANQCGLPYRVFVMRSNPTMVCFNPRIIDRSTEEITLEEGCLSYPLMFVKIKRPMYIKVRFTDAHGETHTKKLVGMSARCFQHEYDHLEGINYLRRANPILVSRAKKSKTKLENRLKKVKRP